MSKNNHPEAYEILLGLNGDYEKAFSILKRIARTAPTTLVRASMTEDEPRVRFVFEAPNKIAAIKEWRSRFGSGLWEAKEAVERIRSDWK